MVHTNETLINPEVPRRFDPAAGLYGQALPLHLAAPHPGMILQPSPADDVSLVAAQTAARTWADKAFDLAQAGDTEQSRYAVFRAEAWLVKMLDLETRDASPPTAKLPVVRRRVQRRSPPEERREAKLNNATLRTWQRSRLCEQG
jgi:hypothetical protein